MPLEERARGLKRECHPPLPNLTRDPCANTLEKNEGERTYRFVVLWTNATPIVDDLKRLQPILLEAYLCQVSQLSHDGEALRRHIPMLVAPASRLFSTNSFTAVWRSTTTWPEVILCTEPASRAFIALPSGCEPDVIVCRFSVIVVLSGSRKRPLLGRACKSGS